MIRFSARSVALASAAVLLAAGSAAAQVGYGVNASGQLFRFNLNTPNAPVTNIGGLLSFVPEGIDFRPGSDTLYAIDIGPVTTQMYAININTGVPTAIGAGFASAGTFMGTPYDLTTSQSFGFDVNPGTLQADTSMRIRLVGTSGVNMRLNTLSGAIAAVDVNLAIGAASPFADAAAYTNSNAASMGGSTQLFVMDARNDSLYEQNPPNAGSLNLVGAFGVTIDASPGISFDILTDVNDVDPTIGGDAGWAVLKRLDFSPNDYLVYRVNLATGQITNGALVGIDSGTASDFTGGFAVIIPAPPAGLALLGLGGLIATRRRR